MNKNKTITIVIALIIILGIIITLTSGFNVDMITREHNQVRLNLGKEFEIEDIKNITNEIFSGKDVKIEKVEVFEEQVLISTNEITDEQKNNLVGKINEKYGTEIKTENVTVDLVPRIALRDVIMPYIMDFVWVTLIILVYVFLRYRKIGALKVLIQTILGIVIAQILVFSILAITRIPVGSNLVSIMFVTYAITTIGLMTMFEKKYNELKENEEKE